MVSILDKTIDCIFSMKKTTLALISIFILGFILRLIAAINLGVTADDMHFVIHAINFLSAGRLETYDQSSGLWFAFTSVMYGLFGMSQLTSRLAALIFGSLSIFAIYLLTKEFFDGKIALISAFLLAIAPFHIKNTMAEMDAMAMFFVLISMYLFVRATKKDKISAFILSGIFMGLAIYTKVYPLLFIPSLLLYFIYFNRKNKTKILTKRNVKKIILFGAIIFLFTVPALTHNYLLYKDKGFMDFQFTRSLHFGEDKAAEFYSWDAMWGRSNSWSGLFIGDTDHGPKGRPLLIHAASFILNGDPVNFILSLIGILLIFFYKKQYKPYLMFFFLSILFIFPFLASIILLSKHFMFLELLLIPMAAITLDEIKIKMKSKNAMKTLILIMLISSLVLLGMSRTGVKDFYSESHVSQVISFKNSKISQNSLIVGDSRIYRGRLNWMSQGRQSLEGVNFIQALNAQDQMPGNANPTGVYFFECVRDDCGWGTIKDQPEFNASMESLTNFFKQNGRLVKKIKEPLKKNSYYPFFGKKENVINIYKATIPLKSQTLALANQPKSWFLYTNGYQPPESQFDYFPQDNLLYLFAHLIVYLALILAILSPIYIIYLLNQSLNR